MGREGTDDRKSGEAGLAQRRLGATGDRDVNAAGTYEVECVAEGLRAGGAGGNHGVVVALRADVESDVGGGHVW